MDNSTTLQELVVQLFRDADSAHRLDIVVEIRDINAEPKNYQDLVDARGRATVPVLRIISPAGESRWMPESADIVNYLERIYG